jgi:hypothetical protein
MAKQAAPSSNRPEDAHAQSVWYQQNEVQRDETANDNWTPQAWREVVSNVTSRAQEDPSWYAVAQAVAVQDQAWKRANAPRAV